MNIGTKYFILELETGHIDGWYSPIDGNLSLGDSTLYDVRDRWSERYPNHTHIICLTSDPIKYDRVNHLTGMFTPNQET